MSAALLADLVLLLHAALVACALLGALAVLVGGLRGWRWVRRPWWRLLHLGLVLVVAGQALCAVPCCLTVWEAQLRREAGQAYEPELSFVARGVRACLYVRLDPGTLTWIYVGFALAVLAGWILVRPRRQSKSAAALQPQGSACDE